SEHSDDTVGTISGTFRGDEYRLQACHLFCRNRTAHSTADDVVDKALGCELIPRGTVQWTDSDDLLARALTGGANECSGKVSPTKVQPSHARGADVDVGGGGGLVEPWLRVGHSGLPRLRVAKPGMDINRSGRWICGPGPRGGARVRAHRLLPATGGAPPEHLRLRRIKPWASGTPEGELDSLIQAHHTTTSMQSGAYEPRTDNG